MYGWMIERGEEVGKGSIECGAGCIREIEVEKGLLELVVVAGAAVLGVLLRAKGPLACHCGRGLAFRLNCWRQAFTGSLNGCITDVLAAIIADLQFVEKGGLNNEIGGSASGDQSKYLVRQPYEAKFICISNATPADSYDTSIDDRDKDFWKQMLSSNIQSDVGL